MNPLLTSQELAPCTKSPYRERRGNTSQEIRFCEELNDNGTSHCDFQHLRVEKLEWTTPWLLNLELVFTCLSTVDTNTRLSQETLQIQCRFSFQRVALNTARYFITLKVIVQDTRFRRETQRDLIWILSKLNNENPHGLQLIEWNAIGQFTCRQTTKANSRNLILISHVIVSSAEKNVDPKEVLKLRKR